MLKRIISLLTVILMLIGVVLCSGCGEKKPADAGGKAPSSATDKEEEIFLDIPSELRGTTVQIAGWSSDTDFDKANIYADFTSLTGIELERVHVSQADYIVKLSSLIAADQAPDVITENGDFPRTLKVIQPITKEATGIDVTDPFWNQEIIKLYTIDGKPYIISGERASANKAGGLVYFNRTTLTENGIKTPNDYLKEDNWNLDTLETLLSQMKMACGYGRAPASVDIDIWCLMFGAKQLDWDPAAASFKTTVASENMMVALRQIMELQDKGLVKIIAGHDDSIANGTSGLQICGAYGLRCSPGWFYTMDVDDLGFEILPKIKATDEKHPYTVSLHGYGIVRGARNPMGAGYYLRYYLNEDNTSAENQFKNEEAITIYNKLRENADYSTATFYRGVRMILDPETSNGSMMSAVTGGTGAQINTHLKSVERTIDNAVAQANKLIEEIINENK
ncbi:MAG: extracellular solute-binding protein [Clostridia bacterium]|nr:extracellular solute-binding protein [Clostridia bacterium]